jgi:hypothetical protein
MAARPPLVIPISRFRGRIPLNTTPNLLAEEYEPLWRYLLRYVLYAFILAVLILVSAYFGGEGLALLAAIYMIPTIVAFDRHHRNRNAIAALTLLGWVIALVWSLTANIDE